MRFRQRRNVDFPHPEIQAAFIEVSRGAAVRRARTCRGPRGNAGVHAIAGEAVTAPARAAGATAGLVRKWVSRM